MISKVLLTELPCFSSGEASGSLGDLFIADLESLSTNRGMLVLVGVDHVKLFNVFYSVMDILS